MKALFFAIIRTSLVLMVGIAASASVAMWLFTGEFPMNVDQARQAAKEMANFREIKKKNGSKHYDDLDKIKDDFNLPAAGAVENSQVSSDADQAAMAKINAEIAQAVKGSTEERQIQYQKDMIQMKNKIAGLQAQLDRIENQNRVLTLQISKLVKDSKIQNQ